MIDSERSEVLVEKYWKPEEGFFDEPSLSRPEDYRPWEATPVSESEHEVKGHQRAVEKMTYGMLRGGTYPYLTQQLEDYVSLIYFSREANRRTKNAESFGHSLPLDTSGLPDPSVTARELRVIAGRAVPAEIRQVRKERRMGSAELAKLTHMFGYRLEYIDAMRADVLKDVEAAGGTVHEDPEEEYTIIAADNSITRLNRLSFGLTMTRIRRIATIGDAQDIERSSFIVRLNDHSRLDPALIKQLKAIDVRGEPEDAFGKPARWAQTMMELGLAAEVKTHLDSNDFETIVPMSTTSFEYDPIVAAAIKAHLKEESVSASDLIMKAREDYIKSVGGIALFGSRGNNK